MSQFPRSISRVHTLGPSIVAYRAQWTCLFWSSCATLFRTMPTAHRVRETGRFSIATFRRCARQIIRRQAGHRTINHFDNAGLLAAILAGKWRRKTFQIILPLGGA